MLFYNMPKYDWCHSLSSVPTSFVHLCSYTLSYCTSGVSMHLIILPSVNTHREVLHSPPSHYAYVIPNFMPTVIDILETVRNMPFACLSAMAMQIREWDQNWTWMCQHTCIFVLFSGLSAVFALWCIRINSDLNIAPGIFAHETLNTWLDVCRKENDSPFVIKMKICSTPGNRNRRHINN